MSLTPPVPAPRAPWRAFFSGRGPETRFQHLLEQMPGAGLLVAPRTGQFLAVNSRAPALTGWTRDELLGRALAEVIHSPEARNLFHTLEAGNARAVADLPILLRGGQTLLTDARLSAFAEGAETLVLVQLTPADERQSQERDKARLAQMLAGLHQLSALLEAADPRALAAGLERAAQLLGADAAALYRLTPSLPGLELQHGYALPANFPALIGPSEAPALEAPLAWLNTQRGESFLAQTFRAAGWTHAFGHPLGEPPAILGALVIGFRPGNPPAGPCAAFLAAAARQMTHLIGQIGRQAQLADTQRRLRYLSAQFDAVTALIHDGLILLNAATAVDEISAAGARMLGYQPDEVINRPFAEILGAEDDLMVTIRAVLAGQHPRGLAREAWLHRRTGDRFPAMLRLRALPHGAGCVLVVHDLARERADEIQRQHMDHLAFVGQSLQSFAHEVRAPLNNISMGVQFLAARLPAEETEIQPALTKIQAEASRLSALMNDMLAWAKPLEPKLLPVDLAGLLRRLLNRWSARLHQRNVTANYTPPADLPPVLADALLLERVFVNLIENALQAMPTGGHLALSIQAADRPHGRVVEVRVGDSGAGIPEDVRRRVFDPYFTTKADGTGLGLAISKRIVTGHRGAIACESFVGTGTIFTVTLPAHAGGPDGPEQTA